MSDILNPSYEDPGLDFGQAEYWTELQGLGAEDVAQFSNAQRLVPFESFEGDWVLNHLAQSVFGLTDLLTAYFENLSMAHEGFDTTWGCLTDAISGGGTPPVWNHHAIAAFPVPSTGFLATASFDTGLGSAEDFEDFEQGFLDNETAIGEFPDPPAGYLTTALFNPGMDTAENFEEAWDSNQFALTSFADLGAAQTTALFDAGANAYEDFEGAWVSTLPS